MSRHAYLLIVHKNPTQVGKLLGALDDDRNLIVVHCDKKMSHDDVEAISSAPLESAELKVLQINDVLWGSYTQVETELLLLREALGCGCSYYHLLSGEDLPLRSQDELHAFFDESGKEFVACNPQFEWSAVLDARVRQRHLQNRNVSYFSKSVDRVLVAFQRLIGVDMLDSKVRYGYGSNWFSVTDRLANDVVGHEEWVRSHFAHALCADEVFLQSFALTFGYQDSLYKPYDAGDKWGNMRLVDWDRGEGIHPYTLRNDDFDWMMSTGMMFGRKFSMEVDPEVIERVIAAVS